MERREISSRKEEGTMKMRCDLLSFSFRVVIILTFALCPITLFAQNPLSPEEILKKVDELRANIERQQSEIERLKGLLEKIAEEQKRSETVQKEKINEAVKKEIGEIKKPPEWLERVKISGDLRLRYEGLYNRERTGEDVPDRHRFRYRLRLYTDATLSDELGVHVMLTSSENIYGQTSNQSFKDEFDNKTIYVGRVWADYKPKFLPGLEVGMGKFKNNFLHTDITWDPDINPEGLYEIYRFGYWKTIEPFVYLGQMMISEENYMRDASLFLWQGGFDLKFPWMNLTLAGSFYDYTNLETTRLGTSDRAFGNTTWTDPKLRKSALKYDFRLLEGIGFARFKLINIPVTIWGDYIRNTATDVPDDRDTAWGAGIDIGQLKKPGDWQFAYRYKWIESDSVIGLFADGDFYGANRRGHKWQFWYRLIKPVTFSISWFETNAIRGDQHENRLQVDTIINF
jgi:hypothetical protein